MERGGGTEGVQVGKRPRFIRGLYVFIIGIRWKSNTDVFVCNGARTVQRDRAITVNHVALPENPSLKLLLQKAGFGSRRRGFVETLLDAQAHA
jgi:hypothetical protein